MPINWGTGMSTQLGHQQGTVPWLIALQLCPYCVPSSAAADTTTPWNILDSLHKSTGRGVAGMH